MNTTDETNKPAPGSESSPASDSDASSEQTPEPTPAPEPAPAPVAPAEALTQPPTGGPIATPLATTKADDQLPAAHEAQPEPAPADIDAEVTAALGDQSIEQLMDEAEKAEAASAAESDAEQAPVHHELRRGRISAIRGEDVFIDVTGDTGKLQGVVPLQQFDRSPRLGSIMDFVVDHVDEAQGLMFLSREGAISRTTWDTLHKGSVVEARVTGHNKGGLELELVGNIRAFMPASQIDLHHVEDLEAFAGQKLEATVTEVDRKHKKVMLSRRAHLEHVRKTSKEKLMQTLEVGQVLDGKVSNVVDYGAFIDIGGVDGLCHVSDLSYTHVSKPGDVVKPGDEIQVKVLKIDKAKGRIALGVKQVKPDPWDTATAGLSAGSEVTGTVTRTANFGAFIDLGEGVEGLLPISEISWKRIGKCEDVISVGQALRLKVLTLDAKKKKMSLSLKQIAGDPWADAVAKFAEDSWVQGKVVSVQDFGAFVELEEGVEGLVHISELADGRVKNVTDIVNVGDEKNFRIKQIDTEKRKLALSLRKDSGPRGGDRGRGGKGGKEEVKLFKTTAKKQSKENLKGGMDLGGMGLGGLSMDSFKK
ncbi:MAG: S1 RNA-binding domain-containing protein [Phycisphaeraceae bacterium]